MSSKYDYSFVPARSIEAPDVGAFIPREARPTVVMASNQASDWRVVTLAGIFLVLLTIVVWIVAHYGFGMHPGWSAIWAMLTFAIAGRYTLIIVNGDWVAHREIGANERTEHHRLWSARTIAAEHYRLLQDQEANRHAEEEARIESQTVNSRVTHELAYLTDQVVALQRRLLAGDVQASPTHAYVPAHTDDARMAVEQWVTSLWSSNGEPAFVPGQKRMPWNDGWRGQPWCDNARELLTKSGIVVMMAGGRRAHIVPNSRTDALRMLETYIREVGR